MRNVPSAVTGRGCAVLKASPAAAVVDLNSTRMKANGDGRFDGFDSMRTRPEVALLVPIASTSPSTSALTTLTEAEARGRANSAAACAWKNAFLSAGVMDDRSGWRAGAGFGRFAVMTYEPGLTFC